jgi:AcrR family transcriptional regulator
LPKIVNKEEKRKYIAQSSIELLLEKGIRNLTVSEVAQKANIGKGTIYQYFENKEDIVFEIISAYTNEVILELNDSLQKAVSSREKVLIFFDFFMNDSQKNMDALKLYQEYLGINLSSKNEAMSHYNTQCSKQFEVILEQIIQKGIEKNELIANAMSFVPIFLLSEKGMILAHATQLDFNIKENMLHMIHTLFDLLEKKYVG